MAGSKLIKNDDAPAAAKKAAPRAAAAKVGATAAKVSSPIEAGSTDAAVAKNSTSKVGTTKPASVAKPAADAKETASAKPAATAKLAAGGKAKPTHNSTTEAKASETKAPDVKALAGKASDAAKPAASRTANMDEARVAALKAGAASIAAMRGAARKSAARVPLAPTATTAAVAPAKPAPAVPPTAVHPVPSAAPKADPTPVPAAAAPVKPKAAPPAPKGQGFKTGEFVVYPAHGVGQITAVEEQVVAGYKLELFVISFIKDKMILKVPLPKIASVGMRKLADPAVVKRALDTLTGRARIKRTMWSRRAQEYEAKINSGDLIAISEVVRDLYRSDAQPEQSYSERQLYEAALDRIARELSVVQKLTDSEALKLIDGQLQKGPRRGKPDEADAAAEETDEEEGGIGQAA